MASQYHQYHSLMGCPVPHLAPVTGSCLLQAWQNWCAVPRPPEPGLDREEEDKGHASDAQCHRPGTHSPLRPLDQGLELFRLCSVFDSQRPPLNYLGPHLNYLGPLLNYVGPHLNYVGPLLNYVGPPLNYLGPHSN